MVRKHNVFAWILNELLFVFLYAVCTTRYSSRCVRWIRWREVKEGKQNNNHQIYPMNENNEENNRLPNGKLAYRFNLIGSEHECSTMHHSICFARRPFRWIELLYFENIWYDSWRFRWTKHQMNSGRKSKGCEMSLQILFWYHFGLFFFNERRQFWIRMEWQLSTYSQRW